MMDVRDSSIFDGLADADLTTLLAGLEQRRFPPNSLVLAEGDAPRDMYVIQAGQADVFITDRNGESHRVGGVGPGDTLGEMSLFTGSPVSATVRATTDFDVYVLSQDDLQRVVARFPRVFLNIGAILSDRLARSNRKSLKVGPGCVTMLCQDDGPPAAGYALACSIVWHTRRSTLYLAIADGSLPDDLNALLTAQPQVRLVETAQTVGARQRSSEQVAVAIAEPRGPFAAESLETTIEQLSHAYDHVVMHWLAGAPPGGVNARVVRLGGHTATAPESSERRLTLLRGWRMPTPWLGVQRDGTVDVPRLAEADIEAVKGGSLPATTAAGRAFGWAARDLANLRVGLAFGAGSIKGYAHIGVLQVLERVGLVAECLAGTSIGSAVASTYAMGNTPEQVAAILDSVGSSAFRLTIPTASLLSNAGLKEGVRRVGQNKRFEDLPRPLGVVAADIATGREVVFQHGLLWPAVLASMSIPGVYPPVRIGRFTLVDGGVLNPVPSNVVTELGADVVIAVKLSARTTMPPVIAESVEAQGKPPSVIQSITRSIEMMQGKITVGAAEAATILLEPAFTELGGWGLRDFTVGRKHIALGAEAAEEALPRIEATLPWLRR